MADRPDLETLLLGPVLTDRECGGCTACCVTLKVDTPDLKKAAGTPCPQLAATGCTIHPSRPTICRTWFCAWRRVATLPDDARPDRCGLIVSVTFNRDSRNAFEAIALTVLALPGSDAIATGMAARVLDALCDRPIAAWFSDGARKMLMHPENDVAEIVLSGASPPPHLAAEVALWRAQYAEFLT
jgi:Fe-S-cluster containining protein